MDLAFEDLFLPANVPGLFPESVVTGLQSVVTSNSAFDHRDQARVSATTPQHSQTASVISGGCQTVYQQQLSTSQTTVTSPQSSAFSIPPTASGETGGQSLDYFLSQMPGEIDTHGEQSFLQPIGGNFSDTQFSGMMDSNTAGPVSHNQSYNSLQLTEDTDLLESAHFGNQIVPSSAPISIPNSRNPNQIPVFSELTEVSQYPNSSPDEAMDESLQCLAFATWPLASNTANLMSQGLDHLHLQDFGVNYSTEQVDLDGAADTGCNLDMTEDQPQEGSMCMEDIIAQAKARRRRGRQRISESSADENAEEYKEFLKNLKGEERKRELNRQAARRCRDKKFKEELALEEKAKILRRENRELKAEKARLQMEAKMIGDNLKQRCPHSPDWILG